MSSQSRSKRGACELKPRDKLLSTEKPTSKQKTGGKKKKRKRKQAILGPQLSFCVFRYKNNRLCTVCRHLMLSSLNRGIPYFPLVYVLVVHDTITHTHTWQFHLAVCFFHAQIHGTIHRHEKRGCRGTEQRDTHREQLFFFFRTSRHITLYKLTIHAVFQRGKGGRAEREPKNVNETHLTFGAVPRRLRSIYSYECVCVSAGVGCVPVLVSDTCCAKPSVWFGESRALADRLQLPGSVRKLKKKRWRETNSRIPRQSQMLQCHVEVTTLPLRCSADFA